MLDQGSTHAKRRTGRKYKQLLTWLSSVDPKSPREKIGALRTPGSGVWFIHRKSFQMWTEATANSTFWLDGISPCFLIAVWLT